MATADEQATNANSYRCQAALRRHGIDAPLVGVGDVDHLAPTGWAPPPRSAGSSSFASSQPRDRFGVPGTESAFGLHATSRPGEPATPAVHGPFREWGPPVLASSPRGCAWAVTA